MHREAILRLCLRVELGLVEIDKLKGDERVLAGTEVSNWFCESVELKLTSSR